MSSSVPGRYVGGRVGVLWGRRPNWRLGSVQRGLFGLGAVLSIVAVALLVGGAVGLSGCGDDGGSSGSKVVVLEGCNPLAANWHCLLPYPSDFFLTEDASMPSGHRVVIPEAAQLKTADEGNPIDFLTIHPADGFSLSSLILAYFPFVLDDSNLVFHDDMDRSVTDESPTVLLEADTGRKVAHFAELDARDIPDDQRVLEIHPWERLKPTTRYIVAIRRLVDHEGSAIPPGEGFALLRDGKAGGHPALGALVDHYEHDIFSQLEQAGVDRSELQLAWDFTTASEENLTGDLMRMRGIALDWFKHNQVAVTITDVQDDLDATVFRRIEGTITVPMFLESEDVASLLHRDAQGQVAQNGTVEVPFLFYVPRSVSDGSAEILPARLLQFGHGFFGERYEAENSFGQRFAKQTGMVIMSVNWWGLDYHSLSNMLVQLLSNPSNTFQFVDRIEQAMVNQLALTEAAKTTFPQQTDMQIDGKVVYDPQKIYYYGISMGDIMGSTFLALSPVFDRAALSVGACDMPFIVFRSHKFSSLLDLVQIAVDDPINEVAFFSLGATSTDRFDPLVYAPYLLDHPLDGGPQHRTILMQIGLGDSEVPNVASFLHAKILALKLVEPSPAEVYGLTGAQTPLDDSSLVLFDFGVPEPRPGTYAVLPTEDSGVHGFVRRDESGIKQIDAFLRPGGRIQNFCDGACDPE
ncbi:MAG: hypothetical protein J7M25_09810 [Deltaproteobacteria bacterium]|nr:hypothetical protein [Deltaproteobacteria bacterium]